MSADRQDSIGDGATFGDAAGPQPADGASLGGERTVGGDTLGHDALADGHEIVDLEARYKIEGTLGQGGMGAVLLATDTRLGRKVAIKRILGEAARSSTAVARFLTEAKALAVLDHANIVRVWDYGQAKDGPFLIMELVDGGSLLDLCQAGPVPLYRAVDIVGQVCDGLAVAHEQGIVHRDIKPANILISKKGIPKLTDFGLAKAETADHGMTMTGAVMGTPDFMPPEQRRDAAEVDHRSDLWSLAATFYQMVTGRSPKIIRFDLLPTELTKVLGKALEEAKDQRYQSACEFRDAVRAAQLVAEALSHRRAFDYAAAIRAIESIPPPSRDSAAQDLLIECRSNRDEAAKLLKVISDRIKAKDPDGLRPQVERATELLGNRSDLSRILTTLRQRDGSRLAGGGGSGTTPTAANVPPRATRSEKKPDTDTTRDGIVQTHSLGLTCDTGDVLVASSCTSVPDIHRAHQELVSFFTQCGAKIVEKTPEAIEAFKGSSLLTGWGSGLLCPSTLIRLHASVTFDDQEKRVSIHVSGVNYDGALWSRRRKYLQGGARWCQEILDHLRKSA